VEVVTYFFLLNNFCRNMWNQIYNYVYLFISILWLISYTLLFDRLNGSMIIGNLVCADKWTLSIGVCGILLASSLGLFSSKVLCFYWNALFFMCFYNKQKNVYNVSQGFVIIVSIYLINIICLIIVCIRIPFLACTN